MPRPEWDGDAMKLAIAFFPLAGAIVGGIVWAWQIVCRYFQVSAVLFAAIAVVLPILVTGGIHMDGYCDTSDALASWRGKERGLEILKDPHVGAFALIRFGVYLLVNFALLHELFSQNLDTGIGVLYFLSRCFAAWSAITMPGARKSGVLASFTEQLDRRAAGIIAASFTALGAAGWIWLTFPAGLAGLTLCLLVTLWYRAMTAKRFGGVTGDTTGYYLQILELALLAGLLIGGILAKWQ
jgi:adenosylcobinamide-GDP ribazoletransferase